MMQPAWTDLLDGLSGVAGRDLRENPVLPTRGEAEGSKGKQRPRGSEKEEGFVIDDESDPEDTPEEVEEDDEPEFC